MNIHRNILKIVAGTLLVVSLPAGAQVLGGSLGGAMNGAFGSRVGGASIGSGAAGAANASIDASDTFGAARERARVAGGRTRELAGNATGAARAGVESTRGAADASAQTAASTGARANRRARHAADASFAEEQAGAATMSAQPTGNAVLSGSGEASTQQHVMRHTITADGAATSQASANRSGIASGAYGQTNLSVKKDEPPPAAAPASPTK
jgi:hypothetical protein